MLKCNIIPEKLQGKNVDLNFAVTLIPEEVMLRYYKAKSRLQHPGIWQKICSTLGTEFELFDAAGIRGDAEACRNDYIRINIPGPGPVSGDGYDWVKVVATEDISGTDEDLCAFTVQPATAPVNASKDIAHFFKSDASSTFVVYRNKNEITAFYYGRNETVNVATENTLDKIRNTAAALGAMAGLSELQWQALIEAFLHVDSIE